MITTLHRGVQPNDYSIAWGGYAQMITILHGGEGASRDPQKWLRNMCMTFKQYLQNGIFEVSTRTINFIICALNIKLHFAVILDLTTQNIFHLILASWVLPSKPKSSRPSCFSSLKYTIQLLASWYSWQNIFVRHCPISPWFYQIHTCVKLYNGMLGDVWA